MVLCYSSRLLFLPGRLSAGIVDDYEVLTDLPGSFLTRIKRPKCADSHVSFANTLSGEALSEQVRTHDLCAVSLQATTKGYVGSLTVLIRIQNHMAYYGSLSKYYFHL